MLEVSISHLSISLVPEITITTNRNWTSEDLPSHSRHSLSLSSLGVSKLFCLAGRGSADIMLHSQSLQDAFRDRGKASR